MHPLTPGAENTSRESYLTVGSYKSFVATAPAASILDNPFSRKWIINNLKLFELQQVSATYLLYHFCCHQHFMCENKL